MNIRRAEKNDLPFIVEMLADDILGSTREIYSNHIAESYLEAFESINSDPNQYLIVVERNSNEIVGTLQLSFIQYLTHKGGLRAQIEAVRVHKNHRRIGVGKMMIDWAIEMAKKRNAHVIQLTSDKTRKKALLFYKTIGFKPSHIGLKLTL